MRAPSAAAPATGDRSSRPRSRGPRTWQSPSSRKPSPTLGPPLSRAGSATRRSTSSSRATGLNPWPTGSAWTSTGCEATRGGPYTPRAGIIPVIHRVARRPRAGRPAATSAGAAAPWPAWPRLAPGVVNDAPGAGEGHYGPLRLHLGPVDSARCLTAAAARSILTWRRANRRVSTARTRLLSVGHAWAGLCGRIVQRFPKVGVKPVGASRRLRPLEKTPTPTPPGWPGWPQSDGPTPRGRPASPHRTRSAGRQRWRAARPRCG